MPILIDRDSRVVAGHARLLAAKRLGYARVPTISIEHLNEAQIAAYKIADNRLSELSSWDDPVLAAALQVLSPENLDFSLEFTGFDMGEIDLRIESLEIVPEKGKPDPADVTPEPAGPAVTALSDLWVLGRHRLLCGSGQEPESYAALMDGQRAAMVFIDPPYSVPIRGHVSGLGRIQHREFAMACGEMNPTEFKDFLRQTCTLLAENSCEGSLHYICMDWRHSRELQEAVDPVYTGLKNVCVWVKDNGGMGSFYRSRHEFVFVYKQGTAPHRNNVELGRHGRNRSNVWSYPGVNSFGRRGEEGNLLALHPTVKPVKLVADAILDCAARGDVVLDAFLGSGTTLIAAERVGRRCFGVELDPLYVDTAIRRWQALTGDTARHATSGHSFDELEATARDQGGAP
jgi:DNA modification methylase